MTKEEKIKEVYGSRYHKLKESIDSNGWINQNITTRALFDSIEFNDKENLMRPLELKGIENNNGWVKIESVDDLPEYGYYEVILRGNGNHSRASLCRDFNEKSQLIHYSHYQKIKSIPKPIY